MVNYIHQKLATITHKEIHLHSNKELIPAAGRGIAARVIAIALTALHLLKIAFFPLRLGVQAGILALESRVTPMPEGFNNSLSVWAKNYLAANGMGLLQSIPSILIPEVFYSKVKMHKGVFAASIAADIAVSRVPEKDIREIRLMCENCNIPFSQQKFEIQALAVWKRNAIEKNREATISGHYDIQSTYDDSLKEASIAYIKSQILSLNPNESKNAREKMKLSINQFVSSNTISKKLDILSKIEPIAYEVAKKAKNEPLANPASNVQPRKPSDESILFLKKVQEEEDEATARKLQEENDAQAAHRLNNNYRFRNPHIVHDPVSHTLLMPTKNNRSQYIEKISEEISEILAKKFIAKQTLPHEQLLNVQIHYEISKKKINDSSTQKEILKKVIILIERKLEEYTTKELSMQDKVGKSLSDPEDLKFRNGLLKSMKDARNKIEKEKIYSSDEITACDAEAMSAIWKTGLLYYYADNSAIIWKNKELPENEKIISLQGEIISLIKKLKSLKDPVTENLLFDYLARNQTVENKKILDSLHVKKNEKAKKEGKDPKTIKDAPYDIVHDLYLKINDLNSIFEKKLFSNSGYKDGFNWNSAFA